jgi:hypothetical protein
MKEIDFYKMSFGILFFLLAHISGFFQLNLRFINPDLESKALYLACVCSIPITLLFYYGWGMTMEASSNSAWTSRFVSFGVSYLVFPVLTAVFLGENFFNTKTIICVVLSMLILYIQLFC